MKLKVAVCDDEKMLYDELVEQIRRIAPNIEVDVYQSGINLLSNVSDYELLFLDIEMPEMNGMELAEQIRNTNKNVLIIFLTSHVELMPEAFKVKAYRFLSKPVEQDKLQEALMSAKTEIAANRLLLIEGKNQVQKVGLNEIVLLEAFGDGTYIYLENKIIESNQSLKSWMEKLGTGEFFQCHKSFAVSLRYASSIENDNLYIKVLDRMIPISRRKKAEMRNQIFHYIQKKGRVL